VPAGMIGFSHLGVFRLKKIFVFPAVVLGMALSAHAQAAPTKVAVIQVQTAILSTKDGQRLPASSRASLRPRSPRSTKSRPISPPCRTSSRNCRPPGAKRSRPS
jgi:hypothetical protein